MADSSRPTLREELDDAYDTYRRYSFLPDPPDKPFSKHWREKGERLSRIYLGMTLVPVLLLRLRDRLLRFGVPVLPYLCDLLCNVGWRISIGRLAEIGPGLIVPHGFVVIDGRVRIGRDCTINPWVTIGLSGSRRWGFDRAGPTIGDGVYIGSGAKVLGPVTIGDGARIGANAVVLEDVPAGATAVGAPARVVHTKAAGAPAASQPPAYDRVET